MFSGPFEVVEQVVSVNYLLRRSRLSKPFVSHVDKLRPYYEDGQAAGQTETVETLETPSPDVAVATRPARTIRRPVRYM